MTEEPHKLDYNAQRAPAGSALTLVFIVLGALILFALLVVAGLVLLLG